MRLHIFLVTLAVGWCCLALLPFLGCQRADEMDLGVSGPDFHDFGDSSQGVTLSHTFHLLNRGSRPIEVVRVLTSCCCLVVRGGDESQWTVAPRATLPLPVQLDVGSAQDVVNGRVHVFYAIHGRSADATQARLLELRVRADVLPDYRVSPPEIDFGEIDGMSTNSITRRVHVEPVELKSTTVNDVQPSNHYLSATSYRSGDGFDIDVSLDATTFTRSQTIRSSIVLVTNSTRARRAVVPVRARYVAPVSIEPDVIIAASDESDPQKEIRIETGVPSQVADVACPNFIAPHFDAEAVSRKHLVRFSFPSSDAEHCEGEVALRVCLFPSKEECVVRAIRIPIYRFAKEARDGT